MISELKASGIEVEKLLGFQTPSQIKQQITVSKMLIKSTNNESMNELILQMRSKGNSVNFVGY